MIPHTPNIFIISIWWCLLILQSGSGSAAKKVYCGGRYHKRYYLPHEIQCPNPDGRTLSTVKVDWGISKRAWLTIPPEVTVKNSTVLGAGYGVFAKTFIHAYTWLDEYEGLIVSNDGDIGDYCWGSICFNDVMHSIDGGHIETSNWLRWLNCPRTKVEENVIIKYCYGKLYYMSKKTIYPGEELFVFYGSQYAEALGIDVYEFIQESETPGICLSSLGMVYKSVEQLVNLINVTREIAMQALKNNYNDVAKAYLALVPEL